MVADEAEGALLVQGIARSLATRRRAAGRERHRRAGEAGELCDEMTVGLYFERARTIRIPPPEPPMPTLRCVLVLVLLLPWVAATARGADKTAQTLATRLAKFNHCGIIKAENTEAFSVRLYTDEQQQQNYRDLDNLKAMRAELDVAERSYRADPKNEEKHEAYWRLKVKDDALRREAFHSIVSVGEDFLELKSYYGQVSLYPLRLVLRVDVPPADPPIK
jgi:hypothetical protein